MEQGGCGWGGDWRDRGGFTLRFRSPECVYMLRSQGRGGVRTLGPQAQAGGGTGRAQVGGQGARMPSRHSRLDSGRDRQGWGAHARATAFSSPAGGTRHDQASVFPQASQSIWLPPASYPPSPSKWKATTEFRPRQAAGLQQGPDLPVLPCGWSSG